MQINENIGVWRGCETLELLIMALLSFVSILFIAILFMDILLSLLIALLGSILTVPYAANYLQEKKRNKPKGYYQKKLAQAIKAVPTPNTYNTFSRL